MPRIGEGICTYCGNAFQLRKEPLGRLLCPLCLNVMRDRFTHQPISYLARDFRVGVDAIKNWARLNHPERKLICISCGREYESKAASRGVCPVCALALKR